MNDFTILHLSDLHIDATGEVLSILLENPANISVSEMVFKV